jgi:hypothetical protein
MKRDPHEVSTRLAAFQTNAADEAFFEALNEAIASASLPAAQATHAGAELPVLYIVGVPRSGTTLLSQLLSRHFDVGYIDNLIARFWMRPSVGIRLSDAVLGRDRRSMITFASRFGSTEPAAGPHEFGYFWRRWLNLDQAATHHLGADALGRLDFDGFRRALHSEILEPFGSATVFKNVICGFQAEWLTRAHPRSLFIHIKRPLEATVRSILQARMTRYGSYDAWWSLKPSAFERIVRNADPVLQVIDQVRESATELDTELGRASVTSMELQYHELCSNPSGALDRVAEAVRRFGWQLSPVARPEPFQLSRGPALPDNLESRLQELLHDADPTARTTS